MKIRESGMPEEEYWESLFDLPRVLEKFEVGRYGDVAEMGCGYGTFSIPVARAIRGRLITFDVDPQMVRRTLKRGAGLKIAATVRDVMELGFGVSAEAVLLFNILHGERPGMLLRHAAATGGDVLVMHWRHDIPTPRGPSLEIRPRPEQIAEWATAAGLVAGKPFELLPWHFGMVLRQRR